MASIATLAAAGALGGAAVATASTGGTSTRAVLRQYDCQHAFEPAQRMVSVTAVMRPLKNTRRMEMRFVLLSKTSLSATATVVRGANLGSWVSPSDPTLGSRPGDVWTLNHPVADLPAPAYYRFQVRFRWLGAQHRMIAATTRDTKLCYQPELRPDLAALSFIATAIPNKPQKDLYTGKITDNGLTGAGPFAVQFSDGTTVKDHTIKHIRPHQVITMEFDGPLCNSSAPPAMTIDPDQQVDDYNRSNNSLTATCPASG